MTAEYLLRSIGRIDDELIVSAAVPTRRATAWLRWGALAAALAVCIGLAAMRPMLSHKGAPAVESISAPAEESEARTVGSAQNTQPEDRAPAAVSDVCKPVFFWNGSAYHITAFEDALPDGCISLGVLVSYSAAASKDSGDSGSDAPQVIVNDDQLVGRAVWQAEDGDLFIAVDGGYARARMSLPER